MGAAHHQSCRRMRAETRFPITQIGRAESGSTPWSIISRCWRRLGGIRRRQGARLSLLTWAVPCCCVASPLTLPGLASSLRFSLGLRCGCSRSIRCLPSRAAGNTAEKTSNRGCARRQNFVYLNDTEEYHANNRRTRAACQAAGDRQDDARACVPGQGVRWPVVDARGGSDPGSVCRWGLLMSKRPARWPVRSGVTQADSIECELRVPFGICGQIPSGLIIWLIQGK